MQPNQIIDFTRDDSGGPWLMFVIGAIVGLTFLRKNDFLGGGWQKPVRKIALSILFGMVVVSPISLFMAIWERWPPQHFISLKVEERQVRLGQRWPDDDIVISFTEITSISKIHEPRRSRRISGCNRVVIETRHETLRSFGYGQSTEEEQKVYERLVSAVEEHKRNRTTSPAHTNNPPLNARQ